MWYTATSASVNTGENIVSINSGDDLSLVQESSGLIFEGESPVEVIRSYIDTGGNHKIRLASAWPYASKVNEPLITYPTDADFAAATAELRRVLNTMEVASLTEAQEGTEDTKIMTPLKVKAAIDFHTYNKSAADAEFVSRSDIVGTVSQSGGVPTGAIIESGSNANGRYWKMAGGQLICDNRNNTITTNPVTFVGDVTSIDGDKLRIGMWF